ncbi:hypothetical protein PtB15_3B355 [Puccinia triticina]|nr:hypothetical protein PtB15_3B355 [Puccinia triticina]
MVKSRSETFRQSCDMSIRSLHLLSSRSQVITQTDPDRSHGPAKPVFLIPSLQYTYQPVPLGQAPRKRFDRLRMTGCLSQHKAQCLLLIRRNDIATCPLSFKRKEKTLTGWK